MNIRLNHPVVVPTSTPKTLELRLNCNANGVTTLEAQGTSEGGTTGTGWTPILSFPTGRNDGLLRLQRETSLPSSLSDFINTGGGNGSILLIRSGDRD